MGVVQVVERLCNVQRDEAAAPPGILQILQDVRPEVGKEMLRSTSLLPPKLIPLHIWLDLTPRSLKHEGFKDLGEVVSARDVPAAAQVLRVLPLGNDGHVLVPPDHRPMVSFKHICID